MDDVQLAAARARGRRAVIMYTLVDNEFRDAMRTLCRRYRLHYCDLLGHPIDAVARVSGQPATMTPGGQPVLDSSYFKRIEAIEFAVRFDDGVGPSGLKDADIVLVGVSRSSKTPLSIYLGYLGYKTANVPDRPGSRTAARALGDRSAQDRRPDDRRGEPRGDPRRARARAPRRQTALCRPLGDLRGARARRADPPAARLSRHRGLEPRDRGDRAAHHQARRAAASRGAGEGRGHEREAEDPDRTTGRSGCSCSRSASSSSTCS